MNKLVSAEEALSAIRPGSRIFVGTGCAAPRKPIATLEAMIPGPADLEFVSFVTTLALPEGGAASKTRRWAGPYLRLVSHKEGRVGAPRVPCTRVDRKKRLFF